MISRNAFTAAAVLVLSVGAFPPALQADDGLTQAWDKIKGAARSLHSAKPPAPAPAPAQTASEVAKAKGFNATCAEIFTNSDGSVSVAEPMVDSFSVSRDKTSLAAACMIFGFAAPATGIGDNGETGIALGEDGRPAKTQSQSSGVDVLVCQPGSGPAPAKPAVADRVGRAPQENPDGTVVLYRPFVRWYGGKYYIGSRSTAGVCKYFGFARTVSFSTFADYNDMGGDQRMEVLDSGSLGDIYNDAENGSPAIETLLCEKAKSPTAAPAGKP